MERIRLKDIAKMANVSVTTVSLVLNNKPVRVSESKRKEIKSIANKYGYRPNLNAKNLVKRENKTIGLIIPDIENPFFASLCKAVEIELKQFGIIALILNSDGTMDSDKKLIEVLYDRDVMGILLVMSKESSISESFRIHCENLKIPLVLLDRDFKESTIPSITFDNYLGGKLAGEYLFNRGHREVGCISGPMEIQEAKLRYLGFKDIFIDQGVTLFEGNFFYQDGIEGANSLLNNEKISAIFACNDLMAYGAINEIKSRNINIEIVGYDRSKFSSMLGYKFPSIFQDTQLLAKYGIDVLQKVNNGEKVENIILNPDLILY